MRASIMLLIGLAAFPASAASLCGSMVMPAAELRYASRGFTKGHAGIDLMAPAGSPVRAASGGTVVYAGWYYAYGKIVDIRHSDSVITRYAHLSSFAAGLAAGMPVAPGEIIGRVGATGRARGTHIHFEVRVNGRAVDPKPYLAMAACPEASGQEPVLEAIAPEPRQRRR